MSTWFNYGPLVSRQNSDSRRGGGKRWYATILQAINFLTCPAPHTGGSGFF